MVLNTYCTYRYIHSLLMAPGLLSTLSILLLTSTLSGIHALTTVTKVSVKTGHSITIPCLYGQRESSNVKYWCHGETFNDCSSVVRTDYPRRTTKASISDHVTQNIFTVSMTNLQSSDSGYYWCAIDQAGLDAKTYLYISVNNGSDRLYVDQQKVTAVEGADATTIRCYYGNTGATKWCQLGGSCLDGKSGSLDGVLVELQSKYHDAIGNVLEVTLRGLQLRHTGWYWCAVGDLQMPVQITVNKGTSNNTITNTNTVTNTNTITNTNTNTNTNTITSINTNTNTNTGPVTVGHNSHADGEYQSSFEQNSLLICLSVLVPVVAAALVVWRMVVRHREAKDHARNSSEEPTYCNVQHTREPMLQREKDPAVLYSTVKPKTEDQLSDNSVTYSSVVLKDGTHQQYQPLDSVTYSSVVYKDGTHQQDQPPDISVTYSSVVHDGDQNKASAPAGDSLVYSTITPH